MGCRIGITTDLEGRKEDWEAVYDRFKDWQVLDGPFDTKKEAQDKDRTGKRNWM